MAFICSRYNACYDWLILWYYSPIMHVGRLRNCKNKAKGAFAENRNGFKHEKRRTLLGKILLLQNRTK